MATKPMPKTIAVAVLVACGQKNAAKWAPARIEKKLNDISAIATEEVIEAIEDEKIQKHVQTVLEKTLAGEKLILAKETTAKKPAAKKPAAKKPAAKKPAAKKSTGSKEDEPAKPTKKKTGAAKKPAAKKSAVERDTWGSKLGTSCSDINLAIGKAKFTVEDVHGKVDTKDRPVTISRVRDHLRTLVNGKNNFDPKVEQVKDGYRLKKGVTPCKPAK